jgi:hypothetical protein
VLPLKFTYNLKFEQNLHRVVVFVVDYDFQIALLDCFYDFNLLIYKKILKNILHHIIKHALPLPPPLTQRKKIKCLN